MEPLADRTKALDDRLRLNTLGALELYTMYLGERLGLYRVLADGEPVTSSELAERPGTVERYVREWLEQHAASGLLDVDDPAAEPLARRSGAVMRPSVLRRYAAEAGFGEFEILSIETDFWRLYRLLG
jgi:hypothetical protein